MSPYLFFISFLYLDLYVLGEDAWIRWSSGAGIDNNYAYPDTSMKLGRNVHELLEFFSLANQNWSIFKMAALKSKMAAIFNVNDEMKILHHTKK